MPPVHRTRHHGFTLVEAMVSTSITVIAGSAILLAIATSVKTTNDVLDQTQATGIAQQLMDEIASNMYTQDPANAYQYPLCPSSYEAAGVGRERFNDIDDYNGYSTQPPKDRWGGLLGSDAGQGSPRNPDFCLRTGVFANWQQSVSVYYVDPANLSQELLPGQTSQFRAVEVRVNFIDPVSGPRTLASLRRVFSHVPTD